MKNPFKRSGYPQTATFHHVMQQNKGWQRYLPLIGIGGSLLVLVAAIMMPLWMPVMMRRIIPARYIVAYAPEPLQAMVFESNPNQLLPTADPVGADDASQLLSVQPAGEGARPTPLPTIVSGEQPGQPITPGQDDSGSSISVTPTSPFVQTENTPAQPQASGTPRSITLTGFDWVAQGWNNCGPATLKTNLSYWGLNPTQNEVASFVKPNPEDRNVRPEELKAYVESQGYEAVVRVNGTIELLKQLIAAGFPVMVEKGFDPEPERLGWMGHYLLLVGYSDETQQFTTMDSYLGDNLTEPYVHVDYYWRHFNRTYLVAYPPDEAETIARIIGDDMDDTHMYTEALLQAQEETSANPNDPFGWFNVGTNLVALGDYENAATAFDIAREKGTPWRMLWYQHGPYEAYLNLGGNRLYDVITLADAVVENNVYSEEAYYYKGLALAAQGQTVAARSQLNKALNYNSNFHAAREALESLN